MGNRKIYEVIFVDEYNNFWLVGFYHDLQNAVPDINDHLRAYNTSIDHIDVYPSTFGECFDFEITSNNSEFDDGYTGCMVRGFIFDEYAFGLINCEDDEEFDEVYSEDDEYVESFDI